MNKIIISFIIGMSLFTSCDYLDFNPEGSVPQTAFWSTKEQANQAVTSMYGQIRGWAIFGGLNYPIISELTSDNIIKGSSTGDGSWANAYNTFTFSKSEGQIYDYWANRYAVINLSNQILENVPKMTDSELPADIKKRYLAEAKFFRAFHHFYLVRAFGAIPISDRSVSNTSITEVFVRSDVETVYAFIEKDLNEAISSSALPTTLPTSEFGRVTEWAAKTLLAKVFLYEKKYAECHSLTQDIINNGGFDLYPDFYKLFRHEQEFAVESIFEVLASEIIGNADLSNNQYAEIRGVRGQFGWGWMVPSDNLAKAFDDEGDVLRKQYTIMYKGTITPDGDTIKGIDVMEGVEKPRYSYKAYVPSRFSSQQGYGRDYNIRIFRFAEVLLMDAEAAHYTGKNVAISLNKVRARAGLGAKSNPTLEDIYIERRLELACEQDRFWDLLRTGRAADVLKNQGFIVGKHELFPVPEREIQKSGGTLTQNPGW